MTTITITESHSITAGNILRLFPFVDTHNTAHSTTSGDPELEGYDDAQVHLMKEECIVLDDNDVPIGSASKKDCTCKREITPFNTTAHRSQAIL